MTDIRDLLRKGALVARDPENLTFAPGLDQDDILVLTNEKTNRWNQPWMLYFMVALNSVGAAIQGWDQTGSNGANLSFPQEFGIADTGSTCQLDGTCAQNSWIIGAINAMPYMTIAIV